jgi:hypothetical protein
MLPKVSSKGLTKLFNAFKHCASALSLTLRFPDPAYSLILPVSLNLRFLWPCVFPDLSGFPEPALSLALPVVLTDPVLLANFISVVNPGRSGVSVLQVVIICSGPRHPPLFQ